MSEQKIAVQSGQQEVLRVLVHGLVCLFVCLRASVWLRASKGMRVNEAREGSDSAMVVLW
jgi:hypothetical protein